MGIFADWAERYFERGWQPIPIEPGKKSCMVKGYNKTFYERKITIEDLEWWTERYGHWEIGVVTGQHSGVIGIDFDYEGKDYDEIEASLLSILPPTPLGKIGQKGWTRFFKYSPFIKTKQIRDPKGQMYFDILSDKKTCVMPPTIHSKTHKPYYWMLDGFEDINIDELPEIDAITYQQLLNFHQHKLAFEGAIETVSESKLQSKDGRYRKCVNRIIKQSANVSTFYELMQDLVDFDLTENAKSEANPKGPVFLDEKYKEGLTTEDAAMRLCERVVDWKKRKMVSQGYEDWDLGKIELNFWWTDEHGRKRQSQRMKDYEDFFNALATKAVRCPLTKIAYMKMGTDWVPIQNKLKWFEAKSMEVGLKHTHIDRQLCHWIEKLEKRFLFELPLPTNEDHIKSLANHINSPEFTHDEISELLKHWLAGMFKRALNSSHQVPVFVFDSDQGRGKDMLIVWLGEALDQYFATIDITNDSKANFEKAHGALFLYISEFETTFNVASGVKKAFFTNKRVKQRMPYERVADVYTMHHSVMAGFNGKNKTPFQDPTGNRRYWLLKVDNIDWSYRDKLNPKLIMAQAQRLAFEDFQCDEEVLQKMQDNISDKTPVDQNEVLLEQIKEIVRHAEDQKVQFGGRDQRVRLSDINNQIDALSKGFNVKKRVVLTLMKINHLSRIDKISTYYTTRHLEIVEHKDENGGFGGRSDVVATTTSTIKK